MSVILFKMSETFHLGPGSEDRSVEAIYRAQLDGNDRYLPGDAMEKLILEDARIPWPGDRHETMNDLFVTGRQINCLGENGFEVTVKYETLKDRVFASRKETELKRIPPAKNSDDRQFGEKDLGGHTKLLEDLYRAENVPLDVSTVWVQQCMVRVKKTFSEQI